MTKYLPGQSGNLNGRPLGVPNKRNQLAKLLEAQAEQLINKVVDQALQGESGAMRLCIERLIPRVKDEAINFALPNVELNQVASLLQIGSSVIQAVSNGEITPDTGQKIMGIVDGQRKNIEISELSVRLTTIERVLKNRKE